MQKREMKNEIQKQMNTNVDVRTVVVEKGGDKMRVEFGKPRCVNQVTVVFRFMDEKVTATCYDGDSEDMRVQNTELFELEVQRPGAGGMGDLDVVMRLSSMTKAAVDARICFTST
jgi:hypothetical protein